MQDINRVAIDLAKNVFQVCALTAHNKVLFNKKLSRKKIIEFMIQLPHQRYTWKLVILLIIGVEP